MANIITRNGKGSKLTIEEMDANFINLNDNKVELGADRKLPKEIMPDAWFANTTGNGTQEDPYIVAGTGGGQASAENYLKSLPGYVVGENRSFYLNASGSFEWGPVPTGNAEKLGAITLVVGTPSVNSIPLSWNGVADATTYIVQRADNTLFANASQVYSGPLRTFAESNLPSNSKYWYRVRATASGFTSSDWSSGTATTAATGDITPPAPTLAVINDQTDTMDFTFTPGIGALTDYQKTIDAGATYTDLSEKPIKVGNVIAQVGQIGVRVKAIAGTRTASATLFNTSPFTKVLETPPAPTNPVVNDTTDTFDWTFVPGFTSPTDYEVSVNANSANPVYNTALAKPYFVGNVNLVAGMVAVRVKAVATLNNASAPLKSTADFTVPLPPTVPVTTWIDPSGLEFSNGNNVKSNLDDGSMYGICRSNVKLAAGGSGFIMFDMSAANSIDKNGVVLGLASGKDNNDADSSMNFRMYHVSGNRLLGGEKGKYPISTAVPVSSNSKGRIRADGVNIYTEVSSNNGASFTVINTGVQPQVDLYIKLFCSETGLILNNVVQAGLQVG